MCTLFDVNALIALFDKDHVFHSRIRNWWTANKDGGWATCPITQNGFVRVMSQPGYPNTRPISEVLALLRLGIERPEHQFWPDGVSIADPRTIDSSFLVGPKQITDIYLLALAVRNGGRLATFDHAIPIAAVRGAEESHCVVV